MHLLKTDTYEVIYVSGTTPRYAILSHRWESEEITFRNMESEALRNLSSTSISDGLQLSAAKIRGACALARQQQFDYIWIDTCCIDKSSSEELRAGLNSMFKWYREAAVCYTFLNDVAFSQTSDEMFSSLREDRQGKASEWFERGWTLQELLAPRSMEFYDKNWQFMGTRHDLASLVGKVAGIKPGYLKDPKKGSPSFREASVATKMSWMAGRTTRDVEDIAYSLLGIFNIDLVPQYGEGIKAFSRLQEAIMMDCESFDESLFAWELPQNCELRCFRNPSTVPKFAHSNWGLLAPSPDCFKKSADVIVIRHKVVQRLAGGFRKSYQGIFFTLPRPDVKKWLGGTRNEVSLPLNCWRLHDNNVRERIVLQISRDSMWIYHRTQCNQLSSRSGAKVGSKRSLGIEQSATATITVTQPQLDLG